MYEKIIEIDDFKIYSHLTLNCHNDYKAVYEDQLVEINSTCSNDKYLVKHNKKAITLIESLHNETIPYNIMNIVPNYTMTFKNLDIYVPQKLKLLEKNEYSKNTYESELKNFINYYNNFNDSEEIIDIDIWHNINFNVNGTYDLFISVSQTSIGKIIAKAGHKIHIIDNVEENFENSYILKTKSNFFNIKTSKYEETAYNEALKHEICSFNNIEEEYCEKITIDTSKIEFNNVGIFELVFEIEGKKKSYIVEIME
ncbi:hypothetical protein RI065_09325 [Mycoplasmatota bacterium zrk1]